MAAMVSREDRQKGRRPKNPPKASPKASPKTSSKPAKKTGLDPSIRGFIKETSRDAGYRKAAQFLMLLGKDEAARVLKHMAPEEIEGITRRSPAPSASKSAKLPRSWKSSGTSGRPRASSPWGGSRKPRRC